MSTTKIFLEEVKAKLETFKADVERLQTNAKQINATDMGAYTATIKDILAKIQQIEKQFTRGKQLQPDTWQELMRGAEVSFADLEPLVNDAKSKYLS